MIVGFGRICEPCSRSFQESLNRTDWGDEYSPLVFEYAVPRVSPNDTGWAAEIDCVECHGDTSIQNTIRTLELNPDSERLPYPV